MLGKNCNGKRSRKPGPFEGFLDLANFFIAKSLKTHLVWMNSRQIEKKIEAIATAGHIIWPIFIDLFYSVAALRQGFII